MAQNKSSKGLGKGLSALISTTPNEEAGDRLEQVSVDAIVANSVQPRKAFDEESMQGLMVSIQENGMIQPLIVRLVRPGKYEIVAGERRWRAAKRLGIETVPVIIREVSEADMMRQALVENIVREDLNPIEEAEAIHSLIETHNLLQEDVAKVLGRSRTAVTNTLRLLQLEPDVKQLVMAGDLTAGHARALLPIMDRSLRKTIAHQIIENGLSVRATETLVTRYLSPRPIRRVSEKTTPRDISIRDLEKRLKRHFGTKVNVQDKNGKGKVVINYTSLDELNRLLEQWGVESRD